jgi:hypothetical protein
LNQFLGISEPSSLDPLQQSDYLARGVGTEFPFARFETAQQ